MDHDFSFKLTRIIDDLCQNVFDVNHLLELLKIHIDLKLSTFVFSLNDSNNEVLKDHQARSRD